MAAGLGKSKAQVWRSRRKQRALFNKMIELLVSGQQSSLFAPEQDLGGGHGFSHPAKQMPCRHDAGCQVGQALHSDGAMLAIGIAQLAVTLRGVIILAADYIAEQITFKTQGCRVLCRGGYAVPRLKTAEQQATDATLPQGGQQVRLAEGRVARFHQQPAAHHCCHFCWHIMALAQPLHLLRF